jgi:predicted metallopeptidase
LVHSTFTIRKRLFTVNVIVTNVHVSELPRIRTRAPTITVLDNCVPRNKAIAPDLIAVNEKRAVVADLNALNVFRTVIPRESRLTLEHLPSKLIAHAIEVVCERDSGSLATDASVIAPLCDNLYAVVNRKRVLDDVDD